MSEPLPNFPTVVPIRVAWGEMDAFQHVNNTVYFQYFEAARIVYLEQVKMLEDQADTNIGPILASTQCRYKLPVTYPDQLSVGARVSALGSDRFTMDYEVFSHRHGRTAACGDSVIVIYDYAQGSKTAMPETLQSRILNFQPELRADHQ